MTPYEFRLAVEAHNRRIKRHYHMLAWVQANLMTMWAKKGKRVRISDLIKEDKKGDGAPTFRMGGGEDERARFLSYARRKQLGRGDN